MLDMNRVAIVTVLVLVGAAVGATTAAAQVESPAVGSTPAADPGNASATNNTSSVSLGASISAFMQSNSERASQAVDQGMWSAAFERSDDARKQALARSQAAALGERLDALAEQRRDLVAAYRNGSISKVAFQARMSALGERYQALNESVDETKRAVGRQNVDAPGLTDLDRSLERGAAAVANDDIGDTSLPANVTIPDFDRGSNGLPFDDNRTTGPPEDTPGNSGSGPPANAGNGPGESEGPSVNVTTTDADTTTTDADTTTIEGDDTGEITVNVTVTGRVAAPDAEQTPF